MGAYYYLLPLLLQLLAGVLTHKRGRRGCWRRPEKKEVDCMCCFNLVWFVSAMMEFVVRKREHRQCTEDWINAFYEKNGIKAIDHHQNKYLAFLPLSPNIHNIIPRGAQSINPQLIAWSEESMEEFRRKKKENTTTHTFASIMHRFEHKRRVSRSFLRIATTRR